MQFPRVMGFGLSELFTDDDIRGLLGRVPQAHVAKLAVVSYIDRVTPNDPHDTRENPDIVFGITYIDPPSETASILIFRQSKEGNIDNDEFISTVYHEVGHAVHQLVMDEEQRQQWNDLAMSAACTSMRREVTRLSILQIATLNLSCIHAYVRVRRRMNLL